MTNADIARAATLRDIHEVAASAGLGSDDFEPLGKYKAKLTWAAVDRLKAAPRGKLVLVTAITPTPAGEGKTTVTIGLTQGLQSAGYRAVSATREPALGPVLGNKGGAAGGGYSQVLPMEDINLFFTGDFPAISAAHNLLSAMVDAHIHHGNALDFDVRQPTWPRTVDMGDRALREIIVGLGGTANGVPREDGFVITPASEVMAVLCLSRSLSELKERLGRMIVGISRAKAPIPASALGVHGAMAALLRDALRPNLVQTMEGGAALVHGGPFANIAHGCSSILASECGLGLAEFTVTEAGFASDLGAEKFLNIVCPQLGQGPDAIVLVVTIRALRHHGSGELAEGVENMKRHLAHVRSYGPPVTVAINRFADDTEEDLATVLAVARGQGVQAAIANPWGGGGPGCVELAHLVANSIGTGTPFAALYSEADGFETKLERIVQRAHGGAGFSMSDAARKRLTWAEANGFGNLPVCVAKTPASLSDDPLLKNAPTDFTLRVRDLKVSAGAGFLVAIAGDIMLMPGLGKVPAAVKIDIDEDGNIVGVV